jgi:hypothetical protein
MNQVGRKIFFELSSGNIIVDTGERQGNVLKTTVEQDILSYTSLSERNRNTYDVIELSYGAYSQDFIECNGYRVNPATKKIEFSYPDPNAPEAPQVFSKALSEEIADLKQSVAEISYLLTMPTE